MKAHYDHASSVHISPLVKKDIKDQCLASTFVAKKAGKFIGDVSFGKKTELQAQKVAEELIIEAKEVYKKFKK